MGIINEILQTSKSVNNNRKPFQVLCKLLEEIGELTTEINVVEGFLPKEKAGKDGIIGETADVMNCLIDLMYLYNPNITETEFRTIMNNKLQKWKAFDNFIKFENDRNKEPIYNEYS